MTHLTNNAWFTKLIIVFSSFAKTIHLKLARTIRLVCGLFSLEYMSVLPIRICRCTNVEAPRFYISFGIRVWSSIARWRYKTFKLTIRSSIKRISFLFEFEVVTYNRNRIHFYPITNYLKQWVRRLFVSSHVREVFDVWKMSVN